MRTDRATQCVDGGWVTGADRPVPDDPAIRMTSPDAIVPCSRLRCRLCGDALVWLDGVALGGVTRVVVGEDGAPSTDPLAWLALGGFDRGARTYACGCSSTTRVSPTPVGHLDGRNIDGWGCIGHPGEAAWPRMRDLTEAVRERLPAFLRGGGWIVVGDLFEGLPDGRVRRHAAIGGATRELDAEPARDLCDATARRHARVVARQIAAPTWHDRPLHAALRRGWKHGELDSQHVVSTHRDARSLLAGVAQVSATHPGGSALQWTAEPGLLHDPRGYLALDEHP